MSERIDAVKQRLIDARIKPYVADPSDLYVAEFNPIAIEMIGAFVTEQLDIGAPKATLMEISTRLSDGTIRKQRAVRRVLVALPFNDKKPQSQKPDIFDHTEIPGWRFGHRGNRHFAIVLAEDPADHMIRESWVSDRESTQFIDPMEYAATLYNCGIKTPDALEERLDVIS